MTRRLLGLGFLVLLIVSNASGCGGSSSHVTKSSMPDPEGGSVPKPGGVKPG